MQSDSKLSLFSTSQQQSPRALKQSFSSLVDAMRFAYRKEELEQKLREIQATAKKEAASLDGLNQRIDSVVQSIADTVDPDVVKELASQIVGFSLLAIEQTKGKINQKIKAELSENGAALDSESTKTRKSLEAFIATMPFPVLDKVLNVKLVDGAYLARGTYRCADNILYEFSYDTKKSRILNKELRLSTFVKDFKIPISVGKNWLRKDQVPDYEKIDRYALLSAESSESNLIAIFEHEEKATRLKLVYSKHDSHSSLSVEYSDTQKTVDVSGTPSLNRFLAADPLEQMAERLWLAIIDLENYKSGLQKLVYEGQDVLQNLDCFPFFAKSWKTMSPRVVQEIGKNADGQSDESLNKDYVLEKIGLLGDNAGALLDSLGLKKPT